MLTHIKIKSNSQNKDTAKQPNEKAHSQKTVQLSGSLAWIAIWNQELAACIARSLAERERGLTRDSSREATRGFLVRIQNRAGS